MIIQFKKLTPQAVLPAYAHPDDAGMDLVAAETVTIPAGGRALIGTGLALALPPETEAQVRSRSGLAAKHGVAVLNSPGTIDAGYRGEIKVILFNSGAEPFAVTPGMRIAQLVVAPVLRVTPREVETLPEAGRGANGFGSTGV